MPRSFLGANLCDVTTFHLSQKQDRSSVFVSAEKQDFEEIVRNRFGKAGMFVAQNNNTRAFGVCAEATSMRWQAWLKAALSERNQMRRHPL